MATKAKRHTHKYYKTTLGHVNVWACGLGDCNHYMPPHLSGMVAGKDTLCWKCNEVTTLDSRTMRMDKPLCIECDSNAVSQDLDVQRIGEMIGHLTGTDLDDNDGE